jgi:hypothetical protein
MARRKPRRRPLEVDLVRDAPPDAPPGMQVTDVAGNARPRRQAAPPLSARQLAALREELIEHGPGPLDLGEAAGRPPGPHLWPLDVFMPLFEQTRRALRDDFKRRPTGPEVRAAMQFESGQRLTATTFRERWQAANPGRRWDQLEWR